MRLPPPSRFLLPSVCSSEAVVARWRRTWWPRQEMLQERETEGLFKPLTPHLTFYPLPHEISVSSVLHTSVLFFTLTTSQHSFSVLHLVLTFSASSVPHFHMPSPLFCALSFPAAALIKVLRPAVKEMRILPLSQDIQIKNNYRSH